MDRNDMLELSRRMTVQRSSVQRVAGAYMDEEGFIDGNFNSHFLKLDAREKDQLLNIAGKILKSKTNEELKEYELSKEARGPRGVSKILDVLLAEGLKNDALLMTFYELIGEKFNIGEPYVIYVLYDSYDIPLKGTDKERQWESEEVYNYLIFAVCRLKDEYEPGEIEAGFLYPSFANRSEYRDHFAFYRPSETEETNRVLEIFLQ